MKIKKGDNVKILSGKDRNKKSKVLRVLPNEQKVVVEGINIVKKHKKPKGGGSKGQIISIASPMSVSNVQLVCPKCGKPSRIGQKMVADNKVRICKKCSAEV